MDDNLSKARWEVRKAVLDVVAFDHHDHETSSEVAHSDYLESLLDEALEEYAKAWSIQNLKVELEIAKKELERKRAETLHLIDPKSGDIFQHFFNPDMP
jgi:hypothetical protein